MRDGQARSRAHRQREVSPSFAHRRAALLAIVAGVGACVASDPGIHMSEVPGAEPLPTTSAKASVVASTSATSSASATAEVVASATASATASASSSSSEGENTLTAGTTSPTASAKPTPGSWAEHPTSVPPSFRYCFHSPPSGCPSLTSQKLHDWTRATLTKGPRSGRLAGNVVCCYEGRSQMIKGRPMFVRARGQSEARIAPIARVASWV